MRRKLLAIALIVFCLTLCIGSTAAYYTATDRIQNVITAGNIQIELVEKDKDGNEFTSPVLNALPGTSEAKVVSIKNTGRKDAWVRMSVSVVAEFANKELGEPNLDFITLDYNTTDWTLDGDYYYYNSKLAPDEETIPLFTTVSFDKTMNNDYGNAKVEVNVTCFAVQCANNGEDVFEASGWPEKN